MANQEEILGLLYKVQVKLGIHYL